MSKKILSLVLVAVMLFSLAGVSVGAAEETEPPAPELTLTRNLAITVFDTYTLTEGALANFGVEVKINSKNVVALDGSKVDLTTTITEISSSRPEEELVVYDPENPEPFLDVFRFTAEEEKASLPINISFRVDFTDSEIFGELDYEIVINGFSAPPDLGINLGDAVAVPTAITQTGSFDEFPELKPGSLTVLNASKKQFYLDSEKPELEGTSLQVATADIRYDKDGNVTSSKDLLVGTVTYSSANAHLFTTIPEKTEKIPFGTKEISTYFFGNKFSVIPVNVEHAWSSGPVSITTDKYTDNKPGYHAIVCDGCGLSHTAEKHRPEIELDAAGNPILDAEGNPVQKWTSNEDASFVGNGTASSTCQDCGATLTKDVHGTAGFNSAFANYHFLLVIFEYINLILRFIGTAVG